jgi:hypothetical protein
MNSTGGFDQNFDSQTQPINRSNTQGNSQRDLGANLTRDRSYDRLSNQPIPEESYAKTMVRGGMAGSKGNFDIAASHKLEDSTAAPDRPPRRLNGLTPFLRKEYYRVVGIYINRSRAESDKLKQFWKDSVSETYKKLREKQSNLARKGDPFAQTQTFGASAVP